MTKGIQRRALLTIYRCSTTTFGANFAFEGGKEVSLGFCTFLFRSSGAMQNDDRGKEDFFFLYCSSSSSERYLDQRRLLGARSICLFPRKANFRLRLLDLIHFVAHHVLNVTEKCIARDLTDREGDGNRERKLSKRSSQLDNFIT